MASPSRAKNISFELKKTTPMKIAATCDIHYDLIRSQNDMDDFMRFIKSLEVQEPDVLIIAGDIVGLGVSKLEECLMLFEKVSTERLMVLGNHDHWSANMDTLSHLEMTVEKIENCGFHLLDRNPKIIGNIGFAGNCCWYDYTFADQELPVNSSYEKKVLHGRIMWNDARFIKLGKTDMEYTDELINKLETDIQNIQDKSKIIITVTHHIGFQEMVIKKENDIEWNFNNAYMGSKRLGEMLLRHPQVKCHICGHSHSNSQVKKGHLLSINPGSTYKKKKCIFLKV